MVAVFLVRREGGGGGRGGELRSFNSDLKQSGRHVKENVNYGNNLSLHSEFREWLDLFTVSYSATPQLCEQR